MNTQSRIFIVATPIGNLEDCSPRAIAALREADLIACEDTRRTGLLLSHLGIQRKKLTSYYDPKEEHKAQALVSMLQNQVLTLALVSDAGTPCIADPGYRLTSLARAAQIPVIPIPGPSAPITLASVAGLPTDRLLFVGFLPRKKNELLREFASWSATQSSVIAFESCARLVDTLLVLQEALPQATVAVGRELTKIHEEIITADVNECLRWAQEHKTLKGEAVLMVALPAAAVAESQELTPALQEKARFLLAKGLSVKDISGFLSDENTSKKQIYDFLIKAEK